MQSPAPDDPEHVQDFGRALFRPFSVADFVAALPPTVRAIAVFDRTKEPGAIGEPLYHYVVAALSEVRLNAARPNGVRPKADTTYDVDAYEGQHDVDATTDVRGVRLQPDPYVIGGRYGLGSKEFTPAMPRRTSTSSTGRRPGSTSPSASWTM